MDETSSRQLRARIDAPMRANGDERKPHVDSYFDRSSRLLIIIRAHIFFTGIDLLSLLHPSGHLHVMHACAQPLRVGSRIGTIVGFSCIPIAIC